VIREHLVGRQVDLEVIVRKGHRLSKISLIVSPAKGCLTCSYIHRYMQNKSRPNSRKILVQASHTTCVLGSAKCVGWRREVGGGVSAEMGPTHRDRPTNSPSEETTDPRTPSSEGLF